MLRGTRGEMRIGILQYPTRYTNLDTTWRSHITAAARKLKPKEPKKESAKK